MDDWRSRGEDATHSGGEAAMPEQFISEPINPVAETFDTGRMASGEPGLPRKFLWRGNTVQVIEVRRMWKSTGDCRHGSGEQYVRKHWYEVATVDDGVMTIYFERSFRRRHAAARWWLFSRTQT